MHDINTLKSEPEAFNRSMKARGLDVKAQEIIDIYKRVTTARKKFEQLQSKRNSKAKDIGKYLATRAYEEADIAKELAQALKRDADLAKQEMNAETELFNDKINRIPNQLAEDVPLGIDESDNVELYRIGEITKKQGLHHYEYGEMLADMDFDAATKITGTRFVILKRDLARLERAIGQFMLDTHIDEHGLMEFSVPFLVNNASLMGTGQLPKFEEDLYKLDNGYYLSPTSEVQLSNIVANEIVAADQLPIRMTAATACFRSEAGAAGKDTRGMIRQHQFGKVEMVTVCDPVDQIKEFDRMLNCAENILKKLALPYRVMLLCSGDTGFAATKTCDLEVWLPGQQRYREISSVSMTGCFQSRRMNARFRRENNKKPEFLATLNGSGLAIGRTLIAVIENYGQENGDIVVPEVLRPYMGGKEKIVSPRNEV